MKKNLVRRVASLVSAAALSVGAVCMFAGCTSKHPVVEITYTFHGSDYVVEYELSRISAPQTVQHFIDLADAGYYDGTCIHNFDDTYLYGGGYTIENGVLKEKDYFAEVQALDKDGKFTQSVWTTGSARNPLYTLYGEFAANGSVATTQEYRHSKGALVMYYTDKTDSAKGIEVTVKRNDKGEGNDGNEYQPANYSTNSATSLFYTYLGATNSTRDNSYCVFGKTTSAGLETLEDLLAAIDDYRNDLEDENGEGGDKFTTTQDVTVDTLDHGSDAAFESVRKGGVQETFNVPLEEPITVTTVRVTKY